MTPHLHRKAALLLLSLTALLSAASARAGVIHDESSDGDLANALVTAPWASPGTHLGVLGVGASTVIGTFGRAGSVSDTDVLTWTIAPGHRLDAIQWAGTVLEGNTGHGSYLAIAAGTTVGTGMATAAGNLADALVAGSSELLATWQAAPYQFGTGLVAPLAAGTYTLWASETGARLGYTMSFHVSAVPEPGAAGLALLGLAWLVLQRRRR